VAAQKHVFVPALHNILSDPSIKRMVHAVKLLVGNAVESQRILPHTQYLEFQGIAKGMGVEVSELVLVAAFYDLVAAKTSPFTYGKACTGVVAQSTGGEIIHGRNLTSSSTMSWQKSHSSLIFCAMAPHSTLL